MSAFILVRPDGQRWPLSLPTPEANWLRADGHTCPDCGASSLEVRGVHQRDAADDHAVEADARAKCCAATVGTLRYEPDTLFGMTEDRAVLHGPWRVF